MEILIFLSLVALVSASVDIWNLIHFSKTKEQIRECLEKRTDLLKDLQVYTCDNYAVYLIDTLSNFTHQQTILTHFDPHFFDHTRGEHR